jgi:hypothetical protein
MRPDTQTGITVNYRQGKKVFTVDTNKATHNNRILRDLSGYEKRKFENRLVLENAKEPIKVIYY